MGIEDSVNVDTWNKKLKDSAVSQLQKILPNSDILECEKFVDCLLDAARSRSISDLSNVFLKK